ncbi:MAG: DUF1599 domain-containing protein [Bacteroidales bacterium]
MDSGKALNLFNTHFLNAKNLMMDKNHDYDEAWRNMQVSSLTDIILMKLLRVKQIEDNEGKLPWAKVWMPITMTSSIIRVLLIKLEGIEK